MPSRYFNSSLHVGTVYYPEQWPEERWATDAKLMHDAGVTTVRMAEFAWHRFEPVEGRYEFGWLERAIDVFSRHGADIILCTPTPTYPAWLHRKHPDIHQVRSNGTIKEFGQRQDACKNHPGYRESAMRITEAVTKHFGSHPSVVAWQTDNELGCHGTARCFCGYCERAFQSWLSRRFGGDIERLNDAWGTAFWSQRYNDFSEISPPRDTADREATAGQNPGLSLDFYRFSSDVQVQFNRELADIIRRNSPSRPVTHNLMGGFTHINYFHLARDLDVVSWDNYPFFQPQSDHLPPAPLPHDLMRGLKRRNVWVMEQAAGPGGWDRFFPTPEPGRMRLWAFQTYAHGADYVSFFRWRSARFGTEQYWHGIVPHSGVPDRRYDEVRGLSDEIELLSSELDASTVECEVAIVYDYDSLWALEIQPHSERGISYHEQAGNYASAFARLGVGVDIVSPETDISKYRIVVAPSLHVTTSGIISWLREYVSDGGILLLSARSGVKDEENAIHESVLPAGVDDIVGCRVGDYDSFSYIPDAGVSVIMAGHRIVARHLAELLDPGPGAETLLTYEGRYYSGRPAAVRNQFGRGEGCYLGTFLDVEGLATFLPRLLEKSGILYAPDLDPAIEVTVRNRDSVRYRFYLNHSTTERSVRTVKPGRELLCGKTVGETLTLPPLGVAVVREG